MKAGFQLVIANALLRHRLPPSPLSERILPIPGFKWDKVSEVRLRVTYDDSEAVYFQ